MYIADMNVSEQQKKKKNFLLNYIILLQHKLLKKVTDEMSKCMYVQFTHYIIKIYTF